MANDLRVSILAEAAEIAMHHPSKDAQAFACSVTDFLASPVAPEQVVAENFIGYLCRAWGETEHPSAELVRDLDGVRRFMVREWLGEEDATDYDGTPTLPAIMEEIEGRDWRDDGEWHIEFEIGGVSVEQVFGTAISASPEAAPAAPLLMQDENSGRDGRRYNEWHASRPDARLNAREAAAATPAAPSAGVDAERALFEATMAVRSPGCDFHRFNKDNYSNRAVHNSWDGWMARAALAQPAPVQAGAQQAVGDDVPEGCTPADARMLRTANHGLAAENDRLREALQFYADGSHFTMHDSDAWDTVSGEPPNFWEDDANTATVEDGSVAKQALAAPTQAGAGDAKGGA